MLFFAPSTSKFRQKKAEMQKKAKMQKKAEMQKKSKNAKKAETQKKSRKCTFDFKIHAKKKAENAFQFENSCQKRAKMEKRKHIYLNFFAFISLVHFFCILNLKINIKKDKNAKKSKQFFSNCKNKHAKKKHKIIFQKKMQKKIKNPKKRCKKKACGV